jgi:ABC-type sugar transport system substrate-binding protein
MRRRAAWVVAIAVLLVVFATGCGKVKGVEAQKGPVADRAKREGKLAAQNAGGRTKVPSATVMLLMMNGKDDSSVRLKNEITDLSKLKLGWAPLPCDGKGDAKALEMCAIGAIDSGPPDFIISNGVTPKDMSRILKKAAFKKVPVINIGASVAPSKLISASYTPDDRAQARLINGYMIKRLKRIPVSARKIVVLSSSTGGGSARLRQLRSDIKGTGIQIVDAAQADLKQPKTDNETVKKLLEKHPNTQAVWLAQGSSVEPAGKAVDKAFKNLTFPDRPLVVGFNADPTAAEAIRDGEADAVADVPYDATLYMAIDKIQENLARQEPLPTTNPNYPLDFLDQELVTRDNVPDKMKFRAPREDFVSFFLSKWRREFGPPPKPGG